MTNKRDPENIQCPVCGYYCNGTGGTGCIDKPTLVLNVKKNLLKSKPDKIEVDKKTRLLI